MRKQAVFRIRTLTGLVLLLALILIGRLYQIQVVRGDVYVARGEQQYVHTVKDLYDRGNIYLTTRDGEKIAGATVQSGYVLSVDPTQVTDADKIYSELKDFITLDEKTFLYRATLPARTYVEIEQNLTEENSDLIQAKDIAGVQLYRSRWRYYPGDTLSARALGFVGFSGENKNEQPTGRYGLERYYEDILARDSDRRSVNFFAEIFSNLGSIVFDNVENRTGDVVTTIEPTVSRMLQNQLQETNDIFNSDVTGGIIINPKTGAIYAMDAVPTFDLNNREGASIQDFKNPMVDSVYEMGSIIKALTMASGLDSGVITANTTYYDPGTIELNGYKISNYDHRARGTVPMQQILNQSLNTGVAFIEDRMGKNKFREYFMNLKLGSETGIDLPNEIHGLVHNLNSPRDVEYATASFGQGIALTPIATVRALSALGNGGKLITPHIASSIEYEDGTVKDIIFPEGEQVFKPETSEEISRMLVRVVDEALRNGDVALPNYTIAAKTGTAQIADQVGGGYYEDRFLHSFFGYFPAYDPEFLVFLFTVEPKDVKYASETLTEPFMEITKFLINYYNIPPDR